ncbi:hypothetical protein QBC37DRAFT_370701 [Rhypophila decipiens]|uniref:SWIRM domain-containing protein n=1 Tax=Rhypophila decipiens TaxID=261697 RepID=A0AAN6YHL3_9PEZI|nr:hypothetical protein QBC37DRAFT_370701 [Rhypophila decipiens]
MEPSKKNCAISSILSPPEPHPYDSFNNMSPPLFAKSTTSVERAPLSPPVSPVEKASHATGPLNTAQPVNKDVILYPVAESSMSPPAAPLFNNAMESIEVIAESDRLVDEHIASRPASLFRKVQPPCREDYKLALFFKSNVMSGFGRDPRAWMERERRFLQADRKHTALVRPYHRLPAILPASKPIIPSTHRVQKPKSPEPKMQPQAPRPRPIRATPAPYRGTIPVSATPEPRTRTVAPNREDKDFNSLPDYSPPLDSLPAKANSLKVDWRGNALDLSKDPHAHLLHPDELQLAATLRLDCATYITSKRRIFIRRLEVAQLEPKPKEFRKTDAQQACNIDVNKASKLWTAYDRVGWLDLKWVQRFM